MSPLNRVPAEVLDRELRYVLGSRWWGQRLWRSAVAAWRCAGYAAR